MGRAIKIILIFLFITGLLCSCGTGVTRTVETTQEVQNSPLPVIRIKGKGITPNDGLSLEDARKMILNYLAGANDGATLKKNLKIKELTTAEIWESSKYQIYSVVHQAGNPFIEGIIVSQDGNVLGFLRASNPFPSALMSALADLNGDGVYELCTNATMGSGWVDCHIYVLDLKTKNQYSLSDRMKYNYTLSIDKESKELIATRTKFGGGDTFVGKLSIIDNKLVIVDKNGNTVTSEDVKVVEKKIAAYKPVLKSWKKAIQKNFGHSKKHRT